LLSGYATLLVPDRTGAKNDPASDEVSLCIVPAVAVKITAMTRSSSAARLPSIVVNSAKPAVVIGSRYRKSNGECPDRPLREISLGISSIVFVHQKVLLDGLHLRKARAFLVEIAPRRQRQQRQEGDPRKHARLH
jgi:hypothetical protein